MKGKVSVKVVLTGLVLLLLGASVAFAASMNGDYKGNPIVNVVINAVKLTGLDVPPMIYDSRTMLPLRATVENMNGIVEWDGTTMTASVLKPETSIYFETLKADGVSVAGVFSDIPILPAGERFLAVVDIGGIPKGTYAVKWEILDQHGTVLVQDSNLRAQITVDNGISNITSTADSIPIQPGTYRFKLYMQDKAGNFKVIAVKTFVYLEIARLSEQPNTQVLDEYFSDFYLGKLPAGVGADPLHVPTRTSVFTAGVDQFCAVFTTKKEIPAGTLGTAIYDVNAKRNVGDRNVSPMKWAASSYMGSEPLQVPVGRYEYKVYIGDVLVVNIPFEVK